MSLVQRPDGTRFVYIDAVADPLEIPAKEAGTFDLEVALWATFLIHLDS
jgi:hypothetical protein